MKNYYIFLDFDGTLWDFSTLKSNKKSLIYAMLNPMVDKESVLALNELIKKLKKEYNPVIVTTSKRIVSAQKMKKILEDNGLEKGCEFDSINCGMFKFKISCINNYLKSANESDLFLVIDDKIKNIKKHVKENKIVKTSIKNGKLTLDLLKGI